MDMHNPLLNLVENGRWFYVRDRNNHPVGCVATLKQEKRTPNERQYLVIAVSGLHPKDQWDKDRGVRIAVGRLYDALRNPWRQRIIYLDETSDIKRAIMLRLADSIETPFARVKEAAKYWLSTEAEAKRKEKAKKHANKQ